MKFLGFAYRFVSNFIFLALVYYSLNFMEKYQQRAILAILVLVYATMRAATAFRSFYFFQRIERLELDARRLAGVAGDGPAASASRKQIVNDVASLRRDGEMKSYIDLLFLALVILLCISKTRDGLSGHTVFFLTGTRCFSGASPGMRGPPGFCRRSRERLRRRRAVHRALAADLGSGTDGLDRGPTRGPGFAFGLRRAERGAGAAGKSAA